jgi:hypothetical protein
MAYLIHIGFDNSAKLWKNVFYFEYKGIRYKLIQNNSNKYCDVLLTVIPDENNIKLINNAYLIASEFISALSWELNSTAKVKYLGGIGRPINLNLRRAKCSSFSFHEIAFYGESVNNDISSIPEIENNEQRDALVLFREAKSTNNDYLSFLFFWQILEINRNDPISWINKIYRKNRNKLRISIDSIKALPLNDRKLGNYFYDDFRNAISHLFKRPKGKRKIKIDTPNDNNLISRGRWIIEEFTRFYIENELKLQKKLYLVRKGGKGFPIYLNKEYIGSHYCKVAYEKPPLNFLK